MTASPPRGRLAPTGATAREWNQFDESLRGLLNDHHYAWRGFRRKRRGLRTRLAQRVLELGLEGVSAYREYVGTHPAEISRLHEILSITVSRFFRDREEWARLEARFTDLAGAARARAWSVGCACGEEPYTLRILWNRWNERAAVAVALDILATDISPVCLERARRGVYTESAVHDVPEALRRRHFHRRPRGDWELDAILRAQVTFSRHDLLRDPWPDGPFDLILCRNFVFTYLEDPVRCDLANRLVDRLRAGGILMVGSNDRLEGLTWEAERLRGCLWRRPSP